MFSHRNSTFCHPNHNLSEIAIKSGFKFRNIENRKLDWKALGSVDVNKVIDNQDYDFLQKIIPKIIEAPMQSILSSSILDPAVSSLFRLAQLSLQYLSFCQQFMDHTLFDLRTAFNQLQKKNATLKHNYKCLEEEFYKVREELQLLRSQSHYSPGRESDIKQRPTSLFPCERCTKNFQSEKALQSHLSRKHNDNFQVSEKIEPEREKIEFIDVVSGATNDQNDDGQTPQIRIKELKEQINAAEREIFQLSVNTNVISPHNNNNDNNNTSGTNCVVCTKKVDVTLASVGVQCEEKVSNINGSASETMRMIADKTGSVAINEKVLVNSELTDALSNPVELKPESKEDSANELYEQTIDQLKTEIADLRKALDCQKIFKETKVQEREEFVQTTPMNERSNDKIDEIQQKFSAFEIMYMQSQHEFVETFKNLDERQKDYMNSIQNTIKGIVEESLGKYDRWPSMTKIEEIPTLDGIESKEMSEENRDSDSDIVQVHNVDEMNENISSARFSNKLGTKAEIHKTNHKKSDMTLFPIERSGDDVDNISDDTPKPARRKKKSKRVRKETAILELEQRLSQYGVDVNSTSLTTPRSIAIAKEILDEREEIKKAYKSFSSTRNKLKADVERIATAKLLSANSQTSLSSHHTDGCDEEQNEFNGKSARKRPKTANIHKKRQSHGSNPLSKLIENDIDENNIMGKMEMAQRAIDAHRECIQELLQTTAHSPKSLSNAMPRIQYQSQLPLKKRNEHGENHIEMKNTNSVENGDEHINRYNKMPNVITRRVVFVNLDEDS